MDSGYFLLLFCFVLNHMKQGRKSGEGKGEKCGEREVGVDWIKTYSIHVSNSQIKIRTIFDIR